MHPFVSASSPVVTLPKTLVAALLSMHKRPILTGFALAAFFAVLYLWGLGDKPFYTKGEAREAIVVWEIVHSGEWILPLRNGQIVPSKPPLFHWCGAFLSLAWVR
jgi:hypothetical protein